jgi:hypothetical protein
MALRHWITSLAVMAVTAEPALAQDNNQHQRRETRPAQEETRQSQPTEHSRREQAQPRVQPQPPSAPQARQNDRAIPRTVAPPREQAPQHDQVVRRDAGRAVPDRSVAVVHPQYDNHAYDRGHDAPQYDNHAYDRGHYAQPYDNHSYDRGHYAQPRPYVYASPRIIRPTIIQIAPYRPYVYRPSWSIGIYYGSGGYYPYGATPDGYFNPIPGRYYGGVRITGAPREARVFADGYFVGIVDDFDGIFQHLNLEAGPHHIEVVLDGYQPVAFDVNIRPGETIALRADPSFFVPLQ